MVFFPLVGLVVLYSKCLQEHRKEGGKVTSAWGGPKKEMIVLTLMSSMACETLILLMAASRLSWSTMMRCCCKLESCKEARERDYRH